MLGDLLKVWSSYHFLSSLMAQMVKNLPAVQEAWVPSLCWEDSLEKGKATHSSILAWRIPGQRSPHVLRGAKSQHNWVTNTHSYQFGRVYEQSTLNLVNKLWLFTCSWYRWLTSSQQAMDCMRFGIRGIVLNISVATSLLVILDKEIK